jgi:hypothetical protein
MNAERTFGWRTDGPTPQQAAEAFTALRADESTLRAEIDTADLSPAARREKEEQARVLSARIAQAWAIHQRILNEDRLTAPLVPDYFAMVEIRNVLDRELAATPKGPKRDELKATIEVLIAGPRPITPHIVGVPERLTRMLYERGIMPKPGASHIFESRHGLRDTERLLLNWQGERAVAVAKLESLLELEPAKAAG